MLSAPPTNPTQDEIKAIARYLLQTSYDDGVGDLKIERKGENGFTGFFVDRTEPKKVFEYTLEKSGDGWILGYEPISGVESEVAFTECVIDSVWNPSPFDFDDYIERSDPSAEDSRLDPIDRVAQRAMDGAAPLITDMFTPIKQLVQSAESFEEVRDRLFDLYPTINTTDFAELMGQAMVAAEAAGRWEILEETGEDFEFAEEQSKRIPIKEPELLAAIRRILAKYYTDGIDAIPVAYVDENDDIQGIFLDYINANLTKRLAFTITDSAISFKLLNPEAVEQADFSEGDIINFASPKNCKKGIVCGLSCIAASKTCHKKTTPAQKQAKQAIVSKVKAGSNTGTTKQISQQETPPKNKAVSSERLSSPSTVKSEFPPSLDALEEVKSLGGSTGAKLVKDPATGKLYVMKKGNSPDHIREESAADKAYEVLGVNVPAHQLYETKDGPYKLAEYVEGQPLSQLKGKQKDKALAELQKHFAADALLGNWDVIGLASDNVIVADDGKVYRIDNGGSLRYRAQGAAKTKEQWNQYPTELWSLRDTKVSSQAAAVFKQIKHSDLVQQLDALASKEKELLAALPKELHPVVKGRIAEMKRIAEISKTLIADKFKEDYIGEFTRHTLGIRAAGITDKLPSELKRQGSGVTVVDSSGKKFDDLRGQNSTMYDLKKYIDNNGGNYEEITAWMQSQAGSSWAARSQAIKYFLASQRNTSLDNYFWRGGVDEAKGFYKVLHSNKLESSLTAWHAFNYEMMRRIKFEKNDPATQTVELMRTENKAVMKMNNLSPGDADVKMQRGVAESTSLYKSIAVHGSELTVQKVPYHRIIGTYFTERHPGKSNTAFLKDSENEFVAMLDDIPFDYVKGKK